MTILEDCEHDGLSILTTLATLCLLERATYI